MPMLNFAHGDDLEQLSQLVWRFAQREIVPQVAQIEQHGIDRSLWAAMGALGLSGVTVSPAYGGSELGYLAQAIIMEQLSRASASLGLSYAAHANLCVNQLSRYGSEAIKQRFLPGLLDGSLIGALAMSEVGAGSDVVNLSLKATTTGSDYSLSGEKMWITNGAIADLFIVYARLDNIAGAAGIKAFIVERDVAGFSSGRAIDKLGMRGSTTTPLYFDQCVVPAANVLTDQTTGVAVLMSGLAYERAVLAAGPLGIMRACLDTVIPYVRERQQFGKPLGEFELVQAKLADMYSRYTSAKALVYAVCGAADRGEPISRDAATAILLAAENATQVALDSIQLLGGNGYTSDYPCERFLRDAKLYEIGAGTSEIRRMLIGRSLYSNRDF
ncbi:Acyl-CoA dehydrogenase [Sinobacterium norvegicum]|uniref:Acyl-CoA dehydrogenase n=1 Tax=Sinobacterium norvegicum TaxID=1641715 RepID=A0ABM9ADK8_9GAMM|nr:acyl-CoA dehydrogenase family protein [Sinobacterium norvegicum]CAH0991290.1 Acyl-CoA dehydrogenase [Sinobacterium norvegicum]